jgi:hypothetical protein
MFEIDLLKGKGRPYKSDPKRVAMGLLLLLIPVGATMVYAVGIQHDRIQLAAMLRTTAANEEKLADYAEDMQFLSDLRRQIDGVSLSIADIGLALRYRLVASTMLVELAESLPQDILIRELQWKRNSQRERKTSPDGSQVYYVMVVQRSLKLTLCGFEGADSDTEVQAYICRLSESPALKPLVREIRPASREQRIVNDKNATLYEIELFLKDQR